MHLDDYVAKPFYSAGLTTHTLETHMCQLRQKIESDPFDPKILITKPGGYLGPRLGEFLALDIG